MGLNVENLIENKVYHTAENSGRYPKIFRFDSYNLSSIKYKSRIETTPTNTNTAYLIKDYIYNSEMFRNIREATQDEIDWLEACEKEGEFVDKSIKKEYIVGKWYKVTSGRSILLDPWYIKYKGCMDNIHQSTDYINGNLKFNISSNAKFGTDGCYAFTLIDLSEIQQYLPDEHIDKIDKNMFKKGDYIVITKCEGAGYNGTLNHCYKLIGDDNRIGANDTIPLGSKFKEARLATKEEIEYYDKIGKPYDVTTLKNSTYTPLPFPNSKDYIKLRVVEDIPKGCSGFSKCPFIPKDTITWVVKYIWDHNNNGLIENNRWSSNIPKRYFEVIEESKSEYLKLEELMEGCWYERYTKGNVLSYLVKIKHIKRDTIEYYCYYNYTGNFTHGLSSGGTPSPIYQYKPANPQEVLKYFPDEKFVMSFEEALIECKRRYPIGTKLHPVNITHPNGDSRYTFKVKGSNFFEFKNSSYKSREAIIEKSSEGILWYNGVFAEIVKENNNLSNIHAVKANKVLDDLLQGQDNDYSILASYECKREFSKPKKLEIFIDSLITIKVEPIVELKIKKISKLTV